MTILLYSFLFGHCLARLFVLQPQELATQFMRHNESGLIPFDRANFGHYPYGVRMNKITILGDNHYGCQALDDTHREHQPFIVVFRGGNCTYVWKALNIQNAGGSMAIIVSESDEVKSNFVLANDGMGFKVSIPTIFIGKLDGEKLVAWMQDHHDLADYPHLAIRFPVKHSEKAQIDFALALNDRTTFNMMHHLKKYIEQLYNDDVVRFDVYYQVYACKTCELSAFQEEQHDCLGGGRYCTIDPDGAGLGSGKDILYESIRQQCLFTYEPRYFFKYLELFDKYCFQPNQYQYCSTKMLQQMKVDNYSEMDLNLTKCLDDSFNTSSNRKRTLQTNTILEKYMHFKKFSGMSGFPGLSINGRPYIGNLEAEFIVEEICETIGYKSQACSELPQYIKLHPVEPTQQPYHITTTILIVLGLLLFTGILMIVAYKKMYHHEAIYSRIKNDVQDFNSGQVPQLVEQYIEFYESKKNTLAEKREQL